MPFAEQPTSLRPFAWEQKHFPQLRTELFFHANSAKKLYSLVKQSVRLVTKLALELFITQLCYFSDACFSFKNLLTGCFALFKYHKKSLHFSAGNSSCYWQIKIHCTWFSSSPFTGGRSVTYINGSSSANELKVWKVPAFTLSSGGNKIMLGETPGIEEFPVSRVLQVLPTKSCLKMIESLHTFTV